MSLLVDIDKIRIKLIASLRKKAVRDSTCAMAIESMKFLRCIVLHGQYENSSKLLELLDEQSIPVIAVNPSEFCIRNAVWLVQKLIREENLKLHGYEDSTSQNDSITKFWNKSESFGSAEAKKLKRVLIGAVEEVVTEMNNCREEIAHQASDLIQSDDCIICMALSKSPTLNAFLTEARKKKLVRVLSVTLDDNEFDCCPENVSPIRLVDVASKIVESTKVVIPGIAIFPDGSCFVPAGGLQIILAAHRHAIPVYILAAFYKITPMFIPDPQVLIPNLPPKINFSEARAVAGKLQIINPAFDLVPAHFVSLYVTSTSAIIPAHVYRLIGDYYHPEDIACNKN